MVYALVPCRAARDNAEREALHGQLEGLRAQLAKMKEGPTMEEAAPLACKVCHLQ